MGVPPSLSGGLQETSADLSVTLDTRRPVGAEGTSVSTNNSGWSRSFAFFGIAKHEDKAMGHALKSR